MKWRSPTLWIPLLVVCILLIVVSAGLWIYLANHAQKAAMPPNQWVHLPHNATPTPPSDGYLFKDPSGGFVVYHLPSSPPAAITWTTYHNSQDGYSLNYPANWQRIEAPSSGHAGFALYPPGTNPNENVPGGAKGIGFRWTDTYQSPPLSDPTIANVQSVTIDGVTGQLYTQSSLGATITVSFPLHGGSFMLTADADSDLLIYVFHAMRESLKFP